MPHYGFNFQWMFSRSKNQDPKPPNEAALDFLADHGFDFVRLPMDYRFWTRGRAYFEIDPAALEMIDRYLAACHQRGLLVSLNLHRAPGYCVNLRDIGPDNLWTDSEPQDAFVHIWETFARRYRDIPPEKLRFNLLNEPPHPGLVEMTRPKHQALMRRTIDAVRAIDPDRPIVLDGVEGGNGAIPELADTGTIHSVRGYQPGSLSHYKAPHAKRWVGDPPPPVWPGVVWQGKPWDKNTLREFYEPWRQVERSGTPVFVGEFGCYKATPNDVALAWMTDLLDLLAEFRWGWAMWNFRGNFGLVDPARPGARVENVDGFDVDRDLLDLMLSKRAED